jgi:Kinesin motor domain
LSHVINDLSLPPKKRPKQIDYHASKLTHILEPHLSGNAEMAIILCAFPTRSYLEETRLTFRFGARAKLVTVQPAVNELNDESALIKKLQTELRLAKQQLEEYKRGGAPKELRGDAPKSIGVSKLQSMSDIHSLDTKSINYDEISLGYDDMEAGPGHREYDYVSNQENPPPKNWEEGEKIPGMGGREYVMPKNMEGLPPELKEVQLGRSGDDDESGSSAPTPKTREFQDIPLDLGRDYAENDAPYRSSSVDFDNMLKGSDVESGGDLHSSEGDLNNSTPFDVDMMVNPEDTKAARKYLQQTRDVAEGSSAGSGYSSGYGSGGQRSGLTASQHYKTGGRLDQTGHAEEAAQDGPEQSFAGMSEKFGSGMSKPDTLRGASTSGTRKQHGTIVTFDNFHARHGNQVSWDTVDLDTMQPEHAGKPMKALQSLYPRDAPIPREITILRVSSPDNVQDEKCLTDKLLDAETKTHFMQNRLEMADDLVEGIFKDLERARLCIHDLVYRNSQLLAKLKEKHREDIKEEYQEKEVVVEHYWILKGAMYVGLFFFFSGGYEFFMASVFLVWLILEINLGASN